MPPLSAIERIEVIRGPMSTLYGSDAMGGVVNIITRPVSDTYQAYRFTQTGRATDGVALDGRSFWLSATYEF